MCTKCLTKYISNVMPKILECFMPQWLLLAVTNETTRQCMTVRFTWGHVIKVEVPTQDVKVHNITWSTGYRPEFLCPQKHFIQLFLYNRCLTYNKIKCINDLTLTYISTKYTNWENKSFFKISTCSTNEKTFTMVIDIYISIEFYITCKIWVM